MDGPYHCFHGQMPFHLRPHYSFGSESTVSNSNDNLKVGGAGMTNMLSHSVVGSNNHYVGTMWL